ncbi:hypothetical protein VTL71DRAFT_284 [Oculimacula yallundae]|uniref:Uncharacterized protein n=1 Tax=Oculimacula yallundae TaxID=86028 RepID=A0ABR4CZQ2_9HELO
MPLKDWISNGLNLLGMDKAFSDDVSSPRSTESSASFKTAASKISHENSEDAGTPTPIVGAAIMSTMSSSDPVVPVTATPPTVQGIPLIVVDPAGDLFLRFYVTSSSQEITLVKGHKVNGEFIATMKVSRRVLMMNSASSMAMLNPSGSWIESGSTTVDLCDENVAAVELWMKVLHDKVNGESFKTTTIETIWIAIEASRFYFFQLELLGPWFAEWLGVKGGKRLTNFSIDELRQLMYLCHEFDNAEGFAIVTRRLAYENEGHITELNPTKFHHLHLQPRIISGLNAARGNLKTNIHRGLYINRRFLNSDCSCKKDGFFAYELALDRTGAWPLEEVLTGRSQLSIQQVLNRLETFNYIPPNRTCRLCSEDFEWTVVRNVVDSVRYSFGGLCLDCMDPEGKRDWDRDYITHRSTRSQGCRVRHDQPSFYFSWISRKQQPDYHERERESRKRKREDDEVALNGTSSVFGAPTGRRILSARSRRRY